MKGYSISRIIWWTVLIVIAMIVLYLLADHMITFAKVIAVKIASFAKALVRSGFQ